MVQSANGLIKVILYCTKMPVFRMIHMVVMLDNARFYVLISFASKQVQLMADMVGFKVLALENVVQLMTVAYYQIAAVHLVIYRKI